MKDFNDLEFETHGVGSGLQARMKFKNGYGISVVRFKIPHTGRYGSYTDNEDEWEVAVIDKGGVCYSTPVTTDVIGHCSEDEVSDLMKEIQELSPDKDSNGDQI